MEFVELMVMVACIDWLTVNSTRLCFSLNLADA